MIYLEHSPMRPALILSLGLAPLSMLAQGTQLTIYDQAGSQIRQYVLEIKSSDKIEIPDKFTWHEK